MSALIVPIVEGHGEVQAVPVLIRRIAETLGIQNLEVKKPIRCPRHKLVKVGELERTLELAIQKGGRESRILVLVDAEDDCPKDLVPNLLKRARDSAGHHEIAVVLAKMEFEAWFLGTINSVAAPESIRGAKERLAQEVGAHYSEVIDQPSWAAKFDMELARQRCESFDKCWRVIESLLAPRPPQGINAT